MSGKRKRPSPNEEIIGKLDNTPISRQAFIDYADYRQRKFGRNDPFPGRDQWNFQFDNNLANFDLKKDLNSTFGEQYVLARQRYYNQGRIPVPGGAYVAPPSQQEVAKGQNRAANDLVIPAGTGGNPAEVTAQSITPAPATRAKSTNEETTGKNAQKEANLEQEIVVTAKKVRRFDINSFKSEINKNDVLPTHSYLVTFAPFRLGSEANVPLTEFITNNSNKLILRCESVVLPTVQLLEEENIRRYGYGPVEKVPYGVQFNDLTITWLVDKRSELIQFFYQWMNTIVFYETRGVNQVDVESDRPGLNRYLGYDVGYKDEFTCPKVRVSVYDRELNTVTEYVLYDVFPMNIQSQNLAWSQENEVQKLTVTFSFINMVTLTPEATNGRQEAELDAQATADAKAAAAEQENKKKNVKDYLRRLGQNPQSSVGASSPNATNNNPPKDTSGNESVGTTTTRNLSGTRIGPPA
jgi:hypothetical protein